MTFPESLKPRILFEDQHLVVLDKPAGLLSHGEISGDFNLVDYLKTYFGRNYVGLIHRLDRNTSGIMIVAKRSKSAQRLTDSLQKDEIERKYLAWVLGSMEGEIQWRHFLLKDPRTNKVRVLSPLETTRLRAEKPAEKIQEAVLTAKSIARGNWEDSVLTLLELNLETGRSHQIRAQAAAEKHPLLGDIKYGAQTTSTFPRPALHSHTVKFPHPMSKEILIFEAKLPADFERIKKL